MRNLFEEYLKGHSDVQPFFAARPHDLAQLGPMQGDYAPAVRHALSFFCGQRPTAPAFSGETVIITGQQPGLLTGPLYTIYKAATAVILARRLAECWGVPCIPVFWVGGDDHDFEEVATAHILTKSHTTLSLTYSPSVDVAGLPIYRIPLEDSLHELVNRMAAAVKGSELRGEILECFHETLSQADSLSNWTARLLAHLFRDTPLRVVEPYGPALRAISASIIQREIEEPLETTRLVNEAGDRLQRLGFSQQVRKAEQESCFFLEVEGRRRKVLWEAGRFRVPEEGADFAQEALLALLREAPERFSPNVVLRPIVQQHLFPSARAYVAGPGEVAYWAQLRSVFQRFTLDMPVIYPRARCVLTSVKLNALLQKSGLVSGDLTEDPEHLIDRALLQTDPDGARGILAEKRREALAALDRLGAHLRPRHATAASMADGITARLKADFDRVERTLAREDKTRVQTVEKQIIRLCTALAPWRKPQERVYTVGSFLFEQGWALIPKLLAALDIESFQMNEVEL